MQLCRCRGPYANVTINRWTFADVQSALSPIILSVNTRASHFAGRLMSMRNSVVISTERTPLCTGASRRASSGSAGAERSWNMWESPYGSGHPQNADGPQGYDSRANEIDGDATCMTLAEFVERRFVPQRVVHRKAAGRAHFYAILKHILTPTRVDQAFHISAHTARVKLKELDSWPYMDSLPIGEVTAERIQHLISVALDRGYSVQTVTHIRNVLRSVLNCAGPAAVANAAESVTLPAMVRRETPSLSLSELHKV